MIKVTHVFADGSETSSLYGKKIEVTKENEKVYKVLANLINVLDNQENKKGD